MTRVRMLAICLSMIFALLINLTPKAAMADDGSADRPIRLYASASAGPIGKVDSFGALEIDGRAAFGERFIWGGQLIRAKSTSARIDIAALGQVTLAAGAMVRLAVGPATLDRETSGRALIAQLVSGDFSVKLNQYSIAYVEASGSVFTASRGANFRLGIREGAATLDAIEGEVMQDPAAQRKYIIRPVGLGANISVRARETRQIQMQVTDENDNPVPDIPVIFLLANQGAGLFGSGATAASSITVTTNAQGIATTSFTAGSGAGSSQITATVSGTNASWTGTVTTSLAAGFFSATTIAIIAAAAAIGTTGAIVAARSGEEKRPITLSPPVAKP